MAVPDLILPLLDESRGRSLPTHVHLPRGAAAPPPLIVFGHGFHGHPRKFRKLLGAWAGAGFAVAAPTFPLTSDDHPAPVFDDVVHQPDDVRFVLDRLLAGEGGLAVDAARVGVAGFSLGAITAVAVAFGARHRDDRVRAVVALAGSFAPPFELYDQRPLPLLVVHGTDDAVIPYALGAAVHDAALGPKELLAVEGGAHQELFEDEHGPHPRVVERSVAFWRAHLGA